MQRRSAIDSSGLPPALLKTAPRDVRVNATGRFMLVVAVVVAIGGVSGGIVLGRRAAIAEHRLGLFASERIVTAGDVIRLQKRGGDNDDDGDGDYRITAHYRYMARGQELMGQTTLRRAERERYVVGSPVAIWYLPSEPEQSWVDGYSPRAQPGWPAAAIPIASGIAALALVYAVRRESKLLVYGRPAMATVTKIEKSRTDKGTVWIVHYEWTTLSGATRTGKYNHSKKGLPAVGAEVPVVYDRDNSFRHSKYPMSFVRVH